MPAFLSRSCACASSPRPPCKEPAMWDNARLLNALADACFCGAAALSLWYGAQVALRSAALPLRTVVLTGDVRHADAEGVAARLEGRIAGNLFGVELQSVKGEIEALPWVRRAAV